MLQFDIWQLAVNDFLPKLFTVDYLKCVQLGSESGHNKQRDIPFSLKILTVIIRAHYRLLNVASTGNIRNWR